MKFLLAITVFFFFYKTIVAVDVKTTAPIYKCENGTLPNVTVNMECDKSLCLVHAASKVIMNMSFRSPGYLEHISPKVIALALGVPVPFPLPETNACNSITNTPCPLVKDEYVEYSISINILPILPKISLQLTFTIDDHDNKNIPAVCFNLDLKVA